MLSKLKNNEINQAKYFVLFVFFFAVFLFELMTSNRPLITYSTHSPNIFYTPHTIQATNQTILPNKKFENVSRTKPTSTKNINNFYNKSTSKMLKHFPWKDLEESAVNNPAQYYKLRQGLIDKIEEYAYLEPTVPINASCQRPAVIKSSSVRCKDYHSAFLPLKHNSTVKVGHAIQLGFDVDTLEIHLNEIYDVVDFFFILESTRTHCKSFRKKLTWDEVSTQLRFSKFREKGYLQTTAFLHVIYA